MKLNPLCRDHNHAQEPSSLLASAPTEPHRPFFNLLRQALCFSTTTTKKRLSTSLKSAETQQQHQQDPQEEEQPLEQRPSTVIGTIFGHRRGRVCFCIQRDRLSSNPLLLELAMPTYILAKEMQSGLLRIALECDKKQNPFGSSSLLSNPVWTMYCNGRKVGFAVKRRVTEKDRVFLKTMQSTSVGAGIFPAGLTQDEGGIVYMRASYERVVGSCDSEAYHLINPRGSPGQELSVFLIRSA